MFEEFRDYLDGIYWAGYTEEIIFSNPEGFFMEYSKFLDNYL